MPWWSLRGESENASIKATMRARASHARLQLTLLGDRVVGGVERHDVQREGGERKEESERVRDDELHGSD